MSFQRRLALIFFGLLFLYKTRAFGYRRDDKGDLCIRIFYNFIFFRVRHRLRAKITRRQKERERRVEVVKSQFSKTQVVLSMFSTNCVQANIRHQIQILPFTQLCSAIRHGDYTCVQVLHAYQEVAVKVRPFHPPPPPPAHTMTGK